MTGIVARLQAIGDGAGREVTFTALFPADLSPEGQPSGDEAESEEAALGAATLLPGDGASIDLGLVCAPTAVTWREQQCLPLARHTYAGPGPYRAELLIDGVAVASLLVELDEPVTRAAAAPLEAGEVALFQLAPVKDAPEQRLLRLRTAAIPAGARLRLDAGAGQVREFAGESGQAVSAEILLTYPKPGLYTVALDLLDGEGYWLAAPAQAELEIAAPEAAGEAPAAAPESLYGVEERAVEELSAQSAPWLPYRNFKAKPGGTRAYRTAGGGAVRRWIGGGVWCSARRETVVGGARWYQTAGGDWVKADTVVFFQPSELRGIELDAVSPPPPPPPPTGNRKGVVTATTLNVRARPGVSAGNPPVDALRAGAVVEIFEEQQAGGEIWYRIGVDRWVAARFVRLVESRAPVAARFEGKPALPLGWVVPDGIDVRGRPGLGAGNTAIDRLAHNEVVPILEETTVSGARWCRIGVDRWVEGRYVGVARLRKRPSSIAARELWVGVNLSQQTAVCYEGDRAVYATLIASGLPGSPTVQGIFRTWRRLETGKMTGPGYDIEDVTWTCYFYHGYALHTAYWHDKFGRPRSHGCVNLSPYDAWWIYQWSAKAGPNSPTVYVYWA